MPKHLTIQIPTPCHNDWDTMTVIEQGRYCKSCKKTVTDFTTMTDTQLINFFKSNKEDNCGRFYNDQLNTALLIPKNGIPWLKYFFTISIPAFLFGMKATAQKQLKLERVVLTEKKMVNDVNKFVETKEFIDSGKVVLMPEVVVKKSCSFKQITCTTGAVRKITSASIIKKESNILNASALSKKNNTISIYPNPIISNSKLNIYWEKEISTNQLIEIFSTSGQLIQKEIININYKTNSSFIYLKNINQGLHFIKITNLKTGDKNSTEFFVQ